MVLQITVNGGGGKGLSCFPPPLRGSCWVGSKVPVQNPAAVASEKAALSPACCPGLRTGTLMRTQGGGQLPASPAFLPLPPVGSGSALLVQGGCEGSELGGRQIRQGSREVLWASISPATATPGIGSDFSPEPQSLLLSPTDSQRASARSQTPWGLCSGLQEWLGEHWPSSQGFRLLSCWPLCLGSLMCVPQFLHCRPREPCSSHDDFHLNGQLP